VTYDETTPNPIKTHIGFEAFAGKLNPSADSTVLHDDIMVIKTVSKGRCRHVTHAPNPKKWAILPNRKRLPPGGFRSFIVFNAGRCLVGLEDIT
jgi:hypothetical protein